MSKNPINGLMGGAKIARTTLLSIECATWSFVHRKLMLIQRSLKLVGNMLRKQKVSTEHAFSRFYDKLNRALPFIIFALGLAVAATYARRAQADYAELRSAYE